jgi:hypothetical protein
MRRALGITEDTLLEVALEGERLIVTKVVPSSSASFRIYDDDEVSELLAEDRLTEESVERVRDLMRRGLV